MTKLLLTSLALCGSMHAAVIGINFGFNEQSSPTSAYTSSELGVTVTGWSYESSGDWSGTGKSFIVDGASLSLYHDASNTWRNDSVGEDSVLHGYLDDGPYTVVSGTTKSATIQLGGLSQWLANNGATSWKLTVLMSSGDATAFVPLSLWESNDTTGWFVDPPHDNWPGTSAPPTAQLLTDSTGANVARSDETFAYTGTSDAITIQTSRNGTVRGSIAGLIITPVPEPASLALAALGLAPLLRRRR